MTARTALRKPLWAWLASLATFVAVGAAVHAGVTGNWSWLAVSVVVLVGTRGSTMLTAAGAIGALVFGAWPAVVAAGLALGIQVALRIRLRFPHIAPLTESALAAAVAGVPPALARYLVAVGGGRVDTVTLLTAALRDEPSRWPADIGPVSHVDGSEGGLVDGTAWTVVAAETALVVAQRPDQAMPVDVHLLAAVGALLPHSHAQVALRKVRASGNAMLTLAGLTGEQMARMLLAAGKQPGGELLFARADLAVRADLGVRAGSQNDELLADQEWRRIGAPMREAGR
jgi:hypothetical protein